MSKISMWQAKTNLSKLIQDALNGEEVIISNRDKPLVRLVPVEEHNPKSLLGLFQGKFWMSKDFDATPECFEDYT
jgi:prevent-host-death family protein